MLTRAAENQYTTRKPEHASLTPSERHYFVDIWDSHFHGVDCAWIIAINGAHGMGSAFAVLRF